MPDSPDQDPVPPTKPQPDPDVRDAPPQAAARACSDHGGFSDTEGEDSVTDVAGGFD